MIPMLRCSKELGKSTTKKKEKEKGNARYVGQKRMSVPVSSSVPRHEE
jgi:hypothetical protein